MVSIQHNGLTIQVFDDDAFNETPDSPTKYDHVYRHPNCRDYQPVSQHGIVVLKDDAKISSAIVMATAGATTVSTDAVIVHENRIITRCCNIVFSLALPDLQLNWMTEVDWATCFAIHPYKDSYITHGEISIGRINRAGQLLWQFEGADIFVCLHEGTPFLMQADHILLTDFNGARYKIGYDGKPLAGSFNEGLEQGIRQPWWRFW